MTISAELRSAASTLNPFEAHISKNLAPLFLLFFTTKSKMMQMTSSTVAALTQAAPAV